MSVGYHPIYAYIWVRDDTQRTPRYTLLDPKLAVESISEVPGASKAHRDVVNRAAPKSHLPELVDAFSVAVTPPLFKRDCVTRRACELLRYVTSR